MGRRVGGKEELQERDKCGEELEKRKECGDQILLICDREKSVTFKIKIIARLGMECPKVSLQGKTNMIVMYYRS